VNATALLLEPTAVPLTGDDLQRQHGLSPHDLLRCQMLQTTARFEATVLGGLQADSWVCRVVTKLPVAVGWQAQVRIDGETTWGLYAVRRRAGTYHKVLYLERVG
jgi:hypothetical protein